MPVEVTAFVAVGSNLGDRCALLDYALRRLRATDGISRVRASPVYESSAVGPGAQPDYLNAVFELGTTLPPVELLSLLQTIENDAGRIRGERWAARTLDLDLLLYGNTAQAGPRLTLPHPRIAERNFVVYPLFDLVPHWRLPDGTAVAAMRERLADDGLRRRDAGLDDRPGHA